MREDVLRPAPLTRPTRVSPSRACEAKLQRRRYFIVQTDLLCDLTVLDTENSRANESHPLARGSRQAADTKIAVGRARMRTAADPASDYMVSLGDEIRHGRDAKVGERLTERGHERFHISPAAVGRLQQVLQEDIGRA